MKVELLDHMGDDLAVANAARVSFHKESDWDQSGAKSDYEGVIYQDNHVNLKHADAKLICYLARHKHWTPFAHTCVKFRVTAPIFLARQMFKHKVGLVENEVSRRYVDSDPEFYYPKTWRAKAENVKQGSSAEPVLLVTDRFGRKVRPELIHQEVCEYCENAYYVLIQGGVCPEQARMVLPQAMLTEWIWTGSVASFARVVKQRIDPHAQLEAQELAKLIGDHVRNLFPVSWSALVDADG